MSDTFVILLVGCMVAASCALVGTFLVLRKMALLGDAISHSVLPGIAIGFLLTQSRSSLVMVVGAYQSRKELSPNSPVYWVFTNVPLLDKIAQGQTQVSPAKSPKGTTEIWTIPGGSAG